MYIYSRVVVLGDKVRAAHLCVMVVAVIILVSVRPKGTFRFVFFAACIFTARSLFRLQNNTRTDTIFVASCSIYIQSRGEKQVAPRNNIATYRCAPAYTVTLGIYITADCAKVYCYYYLVGHPVVQKRFFSIEILQPKKNDSFVSYRE